MWKFIASHCPSYLSTLTKVSHLLHLRRLTARRTNDADPARPNRRVPDTQLRAAATQDRRDGESAPRCPASAEDEDDDEDDDDGPLGKRRRNIARGHAAVRRVQVPLPRHRHDRPPRPHVRGRRRVPVRRPRRGVLRGRAVRGRRAPRRRREERRAGRERGDSGEPRGARHTGAGGVLPRSLLQLLGGGGDTMAVAAVGGGGLRATRAGY